MTIKTQDWVHFFPFKAPRAEQERAINFALNSFVEGKRILETIKGKLADTLHEMEEDLQSSISYAGGRRLADLKRVNYVILGHDNDSAHLI